MREGHYDATVAGALEDGATVHEPEAGDGRALADADRDVTARWLAAQREGTTTGPAAGGVGDALALLGGIGIGAALMYFLDPDRGARRRAMVRDQVVRVGARLPDAARATGRDLSNRSRGLVAETRARFTEDIVNDDETIVARVRSALGRVVSHPGAIIVTCDFGRVTLSGPILASETDALLRTVAGTRGVTEVLSELEVHDEAASANVPALQGGRERGGPRFELMQDNWTPTARLLTTVAGSALATMAARRRDLLGTVIGAFGAALVVRGATNLPLRGTLESLRRHDA